MPARVLGEAVVDRSGQIHLVVAAELLDRVVGIDQPIPELIDGHAAV